MVNTIRREPSSISKHPDLETIIIDYNENNNIRIITDLEEFLNRRNYGYVKNDPASGYASRWGGGYPHWVYKVGEFHYNERNFDVWDDMNRITKNGWARDWHVPRFTDAYSQDFGIFLWQGKEYKLPYIIIKTLLKIKSKFLEKPFHQLNNNCCHFAYEFYETIKKLVQESESVPRPLTVDWVYGDNRSGIWIQFQNFPLYVFDAPAIGRLFGYNPKKGHCKISRSIIVKKNLLKISGSKICECKKPSSSPPRGRKWEEERRKRRKRRDDKKILGKKS